MKKLYKNITLFLLPVLILLIFLPVDNQLKYQGLKEDCLNHAAYIFNRIFQNKKAIDVAFIGSSHTISGIDDAQVEAFFKKKNIKVANLGYCRLGRNLSYSIFKELLKEKNPKHLILEVREDEDRYSHPIFPYLSNTKDVLFPSLFFNRDIIDDVYTHFSYKIELTQDLLYNKKTNTKTNKGDFGFGTTNDTASIDILNEAKLRRGIIKENKENLERDFYMEFPRSYLKKIKKICNENKIEIYFLYIPSFGTYLEKPKEYEMYLENGPVLIPPKHIFENMNYWYDSNHLNLAGSKELSSWVATEIENKIIFE